MLWDRRKVTRKGATVGTRKYIPIICCLFSLSMEAHRKTSTLCITGTERDICFAVGKGNVLNYCLRDKISSNNNPVHGLKTTGVEHVFYGKIVVGEMRVFRYLT